MLLVHRATINAVSDQADCGGLSFFDPDSYLGKYHLSVLTRVANHIVRLNWFAYISCPAPFINTVMISVVSLSVKTTKKGAVTKVMLFKGDVKSKNDKQQYTCNLVLI